MTPSDTVIGIDLGTTNSCVAILKDGVAEVIPNDFKDRTTPSMVIITKDGTRYVGKEAKLNQFKHVRNTIYESKRLIGRKFDDECVQDRMLHWPFKVVDVDGNPKICVPQQHKTKKYFYPEEISAMILEKMKMIAEEYLGFPVTKAVVTVPAYFNDNQRQATIDAGKIAGLDILKIINEPTAAAFAYILKNGIKHQSSTTLVFDLGGGTFDVSIIKTNGKKFTVVAVNGDPDLGGADFDVLVYNEILNIIRKQSNEELKLKRDQIERIKAQCIKVKEQLSNSMSAQFDLPLIAPGVDDFYHTFTKETFEKLIKHLIKKIMVIVKSTLGEAKMSVEDIDNIVLVGGSSRIPAVRKSLQDFFKKDLSFAVNPDEAVACGAAYQGAISNNSSDSIVSNVTVVDITPFSLGIEAEHVNMDVLIQKNSPLPATFTKIYTTVMDNQTALRIVVYQGEEKLTANNTKLGYFDLTGIPAAPARIPKISVRFAINTNGVLHITATESSSNETKEMEIKINTGRISETDFMKIRNENEEYLREQQSRKEVAEEKNALLKFCLDTKRTVKHANTIDDEKKSSFMDDVDKIIHFVENLSISASSLPVIKHKKLELTQKFYNLEPGE